MSAFSTLSVSTGKSEAVTDGASRAEVRGVASVAAWCSSTWSKNTGEEGERQEGEAEGDRLTATGYVMPSLRAAPTTDAVCCVPSAEVRVRVSLLPLRSTGDSIMYATRLAPSSTVMFSNCRVTLLARPVGFTFCSGRFIEASAVKTSASAERHSSVSVCRDVMPHSTRSTQPRCRRLMSAVVSPVVYCPII